MSQLPPSSHPGAGPLDAARGVLRDSLGGVSNLVQLVHSLRVGPKALAQVIPDVMASCGPLRAAVLELTAALGQAPESTTAVTALRELFEPRIAELERALGRALRMPIGAKQRLELERVVTRLSTDFEAGRELIDLLESASHGKSARVSLMELVRQASERAARTEGSLQATFSVGSTPPELIVNPYVASTLFILSANLTAQPGTSVHVTVASALGNQCGVAIRRGTGEGERRALPARSVLPATLPAVEAAAAASLTQIDRAPDGSNMSLTFTTCVEG